MEAQTVRSLIPRRTVNSPRAFFKLSASLVILLTLAVGALADERGNSVKVERLNFAVQLSDGQTYNVAGYLYYQGSYRNRTLQVALHGGNYNHKYWDAPEINGHEYSYARYMARQKYAVLALDQLGTGESSKPEGDFVTLAETASAVHQVISQLRSGGNQLGYAFNRVVLVGHSLGSINAVYEQGTYHDADALVTTGLGHVPHELPLPLPVIIELAQHPYFSFPEDLRAELFFYAPDTDPDVIAYDRANLADQLARGQLFTAIFTSFDPAATRVGQVTGPVLVQLGEHDALFPSSYAAGEAAFYSNASGVTVQSLPNVGHDVNLQLDNQAAFEMLDEWLRSNDLR
ncbi:MAG TPA: alpha/beta hydrolase [Pyrinomonadaceae bacterium]|nr:alpha/beta hydrolase [Pyrinomonadaceae bacterium]